MLWLLLGAAGAVPLPAAAVPHGPGVFPADFQPTSLPTAFLEGWAITPVLRPPYPSLRPELPARSSHRRTAAFTDGQPAVLEVPAHQYALQRLRRPKPAILL